MYICIYMNIYIHKYIYNYIYRNIASIVPHRWKEQSRVCRSMVRHQVRVLLYIYIYM